ncbi:hypothetical protein FB45DRAFT_827430 [Roridomyces roridus]|uniref:Signal recognition particle subunit SRP72 n=1 Tax=Roridomyces roridus TaxID=1738132 RepID=A0AAD7C4L3_9AGAR|nr:hypothetical protein FB45DRAFT_827430 [Roridomyces roridus]
MPGPKPKPKPKSSHESKPKTRVPLPAAEQLKRLFKTLCAQIDGGHHLNAIRTCDKILRIEPADSDALQTKLFLLLTTDQPAVALSLIESLSGGSDLRYSLEQAYALYCLHKKEEASTALSRTTEGVDQRGVRHLEAQLNYRDGAYQAAFDIYNELLDSAPTAEEHADILTNIQASSAHLDFINTTFLHSLDALPTSISTQLEDLPPPAAPGTSSAATVASAAPEAPVVKKEKKVRLPPGVVLGVTPLPDPERWLKKSERSTFGQKRRKGGGGATQGSAADVVESKAGSSSKTKGKKRK